MDNIAEAMQKTLDIAKPERHEVKDVHGIEATYFTKPLHQIIAKAPEQAELVHVSSLLALADLVRAKLENADFPENYLIHIQAENRVVICSRTTDQWGRRLDLAKAEPVEFKKFLFGQWISQEEFTIALASLFADTEDKAYVLKMASTLTNEASNVSDDDGFSQCVTVKAGLARKASTTIKPRVLLAPFRTFPEIEQPASEFVFRARSSNGEAPQLMLVEADGGKWKIDAIKKIREAMESFGLNIPIIA